MAPLTTFFFFLFFFFVGLVKFAEGFRRAWGYVT